MTSRNLTVRLAPLIVAVAVVQIACAELLFERATSPVPWPEMERNTPIHVGSAKQIFLDDLLISRVSRISKHLARVQKYAGNPVIVADQPWEQGRMGVFRGVQIVGQTVLYDEEQQVFKMWYLPWVWDDGKRPWCYATSRDGFHWEKPNLGLVEFAGSSQNNIVNIRDGYDLFNTIKTPNDPDPARRYKSMGEVERPGTPLSEHGAGIAFSPDGLHWTEYHGNPVVRKSANIADSPSILGWDPRKKKYVAYYRPGRPLAPHYPDGETIRTIGYSESDDFIHWTPTQMMLQPDDGDRVDSQYMCLQASFDNESQMYIGLLQVYQTHQQTFDTYLLSSRDGFHWTWVDRHRPFLGRGEKGTYDEGYMWPSGSIVHDGTIWVFYGAYMGSHSHAHNINPLGRLDPEKRMTIAVATLPQDRYLGLLAGPRKGVIVTRPLTFRGSQLLVDLDASLPLGDYTKPGERRRSDEAEVRVALLNGEGEPIPGLTIDDCQPLLASGVQRVLWLVGDSRALQGQLIRIRFEMRNAALYSFQFQE